MKAETSDTFYNVGTGIRTTIKELAELILEITGSSQKIQYEPGGMTFVKNRIGSPKKAEDEIGFKAQVGLQEGLERLIAWRNSHKEEVAQRRRDAGIIDE
jgi:UDP-glucose 4-epimerase